MFIVVLGRGREGLDLAFRREVCSARSLLLCSMLLSSWICRTKGAVRFYRGFLRVQRGFRRYLGGMCNLGLSVFFSIVSSFFPTESQFPVLELRYKLNMLKIFVNFKVKLLYSEGMYLMLT
jgi:hypothetical protein